MDLKKLVADKCLEKNAGPFALIPDFQKFKATIQKTIIKEGQHDYEELSEAKLRGMYDDNIVFVFYNKSNVKPLPGKGAGGEKIPGDKLKDFTTLASTPQWRKKLDDFWVQPFMIDNHKWASVEHYYQGSKFKKTHPEFYLSFSLDSGTELSKNPKFAHTVGGRAKHKLKPATVEIDPDFYGERNIKARADALFAKFSQNMDLCDMLKLTYPAKLVLRKRGQKPEENTPLMQVRQQLMK